MLSLSLFFLICCFSGSTGSATEEFQDNFKDLVALASKKVFLPVPVKKFRCSHVPCHLNKAIQWLKDHIKDEQTRTRISLMEKAVGCITSALNKAPRKPEEGGSCPTAWKPRRSALKSYRRFFQKFHEKC